MKLGSRMIGIAALLEAPIVATRAAYERAVDYTDGSWRGVVESWVRRYPEAADGLSDVRHALPEILFTDSLMLHKGGEDVVISATWLRRSSGSRPTSFTSILTTAGSSGMTERSSTSSPGRKTGKPTPGPWADRSTLGATLLSRDSLRTALRDAAGWRWSGTVPLSSRRC